MNSEKSSESVELSKSTFSGWLMLPVSIIFLLGALGLLFYMVDRGRSLGGFPEWFLIVVAIVGTIVGVMMLSGFFTLQPNEARVLILFGEYKGTVRSSGFHWTNPFYSRERGHRVSLWARTLTVDAVSAALREELGRRLAKAGVVVDEARLTNLSYAPEIAHAMLRRQQAEAVIAAHTKIVHGAVTMVDLALKDLAARQVVLLDDERKAAMVSNLMVVLCGDAEVHPVINTGTLYN